jgi:hypothetical protein
MKKVIFMIFLLVLSSLCWAGGKNDQQNTSSKSQIEQNQDVSLQQQTVQTQVNTSVASNPYFTGEGGKGISIGIRVPESRGLNENQSYLPTVVQGVLVANFSKYSAMSVLDRVSLDRVINETLDPTFEDNMYIVRLGHVLQTGNWLTGNIIRTSTGYTLQLNITDTTPNAKTSASFTGNFSVSEFDNHSAINKASLALLEQMGVELTQKSRNELEQASSPQYVYAQTALSQGIVAQQKGTIIEALTYYYNATDFSPDLSEATSRLSMLSSNISSGNIGQNVRNEIQRRNEWVKILSEAETFFKNHPPFEIIYNTNLSEGNIDYKNETVELSFFIEIKPTNGFKVLENIRQGLVETSKFEEWGFSFWPLMDSSMFTPFETLRHNAKFQPPDSVLATFDVLIVSGLFNESGKQIATATTKWKNSIRFFSPASQSEIRNRGGYVLKSGQIVSKGFLGRKDGFYAGYGGIDHVVDSTRFIINDDEEFSYDFSNSRGYFHRENNVKFLDVKANDITDNLIIKIISVNGIDARRAGETDYIKISSTN